MKAVDRGGVRESLGLVSWGFNQSSMLRMPRIRSPLAQDGEIRGSDTALVTIILEQSNPWRLW